MNKKAREKLGLGFFKTISNNVYAVKIMWHFSKPYVIHSFFDRGIGYATWVFYSTFFIRYIVNAIQFGKNTEDVYFFIGIVCLVTAVLHLYKGYLSQVYFRMKNVEFYDYLYTQIYKKAENVPLECFENADFYNNYTMALDDACNKMVTIVGEVFEIFTAAIAAIITYIAMYRMNPWMLLFVISPIVGSFVFGTIMNQLNFKIYRETTPDVRRVDYVNRVMYLSEYAKEMRLSHIYNVLHRTYSDAIVNIRRVVKKFSKKLIWNGFWQFYLSYTIIFEGLLLYGAYLTMVKHVLTLGDFSILTSMMVTASWILVRIGNSIMLCNQNGMFVHNLRTFMNYQESIPEDYDGDIPDKTIESVEFRDVSFSYQGGKEVIHHLSFTIRKQQSIALVGHNGAGKSTIIKLLFRLYDPTDGAIYVNGRDIRDYNLRAYRELFAAAFQDYKIFAHTVSENILMGRQVDNPENVVEDALKRAGVYDKVMSLPHKADTLLTKEFDEDGAVLSGGEFQKIVVARALANKAPIKVYDEPSSALDPIAEYELFQSILEESLHNMMIFISHRLSSVKNANQVFMLEGGRLIEQGTHSELMNQNGKYAEMFHMQAKNYQADLTETKGGMLS